jgi:hypothetical protein
MRTSSFVVPAAWLLLAAACGTDAADESVESASENATTRASVVDASHGGSHTVRDAGAKADASGDLDFADAESVSWRTDEFEVKPGKERYLCFAKTIDEDLVIDGYSTQGAPFVHHLIFSRTKAPQTEGFEECDTAFRSAWDPIFISGAGKAKLAFPSDAGHKLPKGTQLLVQMHLLNTGEESVKGAVDIKMHRSAHENPRPVSSYVFGTAAVKLPPKQKTTLIGDCKSREKVKLIAGFPHMHTLGTGMTFSVGASNAALKQVFVREPYYFDDQTIEAVDVDIAPGDATRVTCNYNNTTDKTVTYGESTLNEMCFFIGFAIDRTTTSGCVATPPPGFEDQATR